MHESLVRLIFEYVERNPAQPIELDTRDAAGKLGEAIRVWRAR